MPDLVDLFEDFFAYERRRRRSRRFLDGRSEIIATSGEIDRLFIVAGRIDDAAFESLG
jgi:hypothetical protein